MAIFGRKDKPKADFSGVQSGGSSTASPQPPAAPAAPGQPGAAAPGAARRTYTVAKGDTLSAIAKREYGDANKWRTIYEANRDKINNPDLIHPGQELVIPAAQ